VDYFFESEHLALRDEVRCFAERAGYLRDYAKSSRSRIFCASV